MNINDEIYEVPTQFKIDEIDNYIFLYNKNVYLLNNIFNRYYFSIYKTLYILNYEINDVNKITFNYECNSKYIFKIENNIIVLNIQCYLIKDIIKNIIYEYFNVLDNHIIDYLIINSINIYIKSIEIIKESTTLSNGCIYLSNIINNRKILNFNYNFDYNYLNNNNTNIFILRTYVLPTLFNIIEIISELKIIYMYKNICIICLKNQLDIIKNVIKNTDIYTSYKNIDYTKYELVICINNNIKNYGYFSRYNNVNFLFIKQDKSKLDIFYDINKYNISNEILINFNKIEIKYKQKIEIEKNNIELNIKNILIGNIFIKNNYNNIKNNDISYIKKNIYDKDVKIKNIKSNVNKKMIKDKIYNENYCVICYEIPEIYNYTSCCISLYCFNCIKYISSQCAICKQYYVLKHIPNNNLIIYIEKSIEYNVYKILKNINDIYSFNIYYINNIFNIYYFLNIINFYEINYIIYLNDKFLKIKNNKNYNIKYNIFLYNDMIYYNNKYFNIIISNNNKISYNNIINLDYLIKIV